MDVADIGAFWGLVGDLWACEGAESNPLQKLKVSNELLDFFNEKPVHMLVTDTSYIWEEAERVNSAALKEIFGLGYARVAAGDASSLVPPKSQPPNSQPPTSQSPAKPVPAPEGAQGGMLPGCWKSDRPSDRLQLPSRWMSGFPPDRRRL